jgi:hypothetical protein
VGDFFELSCCCSGLVHDESTSAVVVLMVASSEKTSEEFVELVNFIYFLVFLLTISCDFVRSHVHGTTSKQLGMPALLW